MNYDQPQTKEQELAELADKAAAVSNLKADLLKENPLANAANDSVLYGYQEEINKIFERIDAIEGKESSSAISREKSPDSNINTNTAEVRTAATIVDSYDKQLAEKRWNSEMNENLKDLGDAKSGLDSLEAAKKTADESGPKIDQLLFVQRIKEQKDKLAKLEELRRKFEGEQAVKNAEKLKVASETGKKAE